MLGNLLVHTDRKGQEIRYAYDARERLIRAEYADAQVEYVYDAIGRLVETRDSVGGDIVLRYDPLDRLTTEITAQSVVDYAYDALGRRTRMEVTGQEPVRYAYDANSRLTDITQGVRGVEFDYDALDRRTRLSLPNGVTTEYQYDASSRLTRLAYQRSNGSALGELTYGYDPSGNRTRMGGSLARVSLPEAISQSEYDSGNRQLRFGAREMGYDANGNLETITDGSGSTEFTWDARGRLTALSGPDLDAAFTYDAFGRRVSKAFNGREAAFAYDGADIVQEQRAAGMGDLLRSLVVDELLAYGEDEFPIADGLGSTLAMVDIGQEIRSEFTYSPYGDTTVNGASASAYQYTGRENDGTGLYHYRARYYHPGLKRFVSEDPLQYPANVPGLIAERTKNAFSELGIANHPLAVETRDRNPYRYVVNNPVNLVDPLGLEAEETGKDTPATDALSLIPGRSSILAAVGVIGDNFGEFIEGILDIFRESKAKDCLKITDPIKRGKCITDTGRTF